MHREEDEQRPAAATRNEKQQVQDNNNKLCCAFLFLVPQVLNTCGIDKFKYYTAFSKSVVKPTKAITVANLNNGKQQNEPLRT